MKTILSSLIFLFLLVILNAQNNLVLNGSFEHLSDSSDLIDGYIIFPCKGWWSPNFGTPDYFNNSNESADIKIHFHDFINYDYQKFGDAFIGLSLFDIESASMEHIQSELKDTLEMGKEYMISFWVRLDHLYSDYATNQIGLYISKKKILSDDYTLDPEYYFNGMNPSLQPQIKSSISNCIIDTTWIQIKGVYQAEGGEKFITIGMFWVDNLRILSFMEREGKHFSNEVIRKFGRQMKKSIMCKNPYMLKKYKNYPRKNKQPFLYYLIDNVEVIPSNYP